MWPDHVSNPTDFAKRPGVDDQDWLWVGLNDFPVCPQELKLWSPIKTASLRQF